MSIAADTLGAPVPARGPRIPRRTLRPVVVAPSREQRRARPRALAATIAVSGVFAILLAQLMLSIQLSEGAYRLSAAEAQLVELNRDAQVLTENLARLESPQNVAAQAESLGMVVNSSSAYLRLADAAVLGVPVAASAQSGVLDGRDSMVGNVLLADVPLVVPAAAGEASGVAPMPSPPGPLASAEQPAAAVPPAGPEPLPAPITR
ncbi:hypothetical protein EV141_2334 [Microcella putealis]|uniref:Cell division protein FtsL n=1 Tax=Microcella putealis TaxID=337005 RepID=A0A4Q7LKJ5_9MICO|nr:hypothetical protein [Microcella putealis]RZS54337.1 hypothetical protein EV141_2334 [Microcella putealis]TQM24909.1 hypothetical protein BJ957_1172 [Microcella putealis]